MDTRGINVGTERDVGRCPMSCGEKRAALAFCAVAGVGAATLRALQKFFGSLSDALKAPRRDLLPHLKTDEARRSLLAADDLERLADQASQRAEKAGAVVVFPGDPLWPKRLTHDAAPPLLFAKGDLTALEAPSLAVAGARHTDAYGLRVTALFAGAAAQRGALIVSGGAIGVDSEAHRAAMAAGGKTAAVFGTGIDVTYPPKNAPLFDSISQGRGVLLSAFLPGTPPLPQNFILRNSLIAALADAVLITRASASSGALSTAHAAHDLGRPVYVIPGDLDAPLTAGIGQLAASGIARPAFRLEPIGQSLGLSGPWPSLAGPTSPSGSPAAAHHEKNPRERPKPEARPGILKFSQPPLGPTRPAPQLPEKLLCVFNKLQNTPGQFDELLSQTGLDAATLAEALLQLELRGLCEELPGRLFRRPPSG